jgi:hypothetical protein
MSSQIHTDSELRQQIPCNPRLWTGDIISQRPPFLFIRIQQLVAIVTLGFLFWIWFDVSTHHAPRPSYPYYDAEKPLPPWSEPTPLEGNYDKGGERR